MVCGVKSARSTWRDTRKGPWARRQVQRRLSLVVLGDDEGLVLQQQLEEAHVDDGLGRHQQQQRVACVVAASQY